MGARTWTCTAHLCPQQPPAQISQDGTFSLPTVPSSQGLSLSQGGHMPAGVTLPACNGDKHKVGRWMPCSLGGAGEEAGMLQAGSALFLQQASPPGEVPAKSFPASDPPCCSIAQFFSPPAQARGRLISLGAPAGTSRAECCSPAPAPAHSGVASTKGSAALSIIKGNFPRQSQEITQPFVCLICI